MAGTVELLGREFKVADKVALMPLLRFAHLAKQGMRTDDMEAMEAVYDLLRTTIADEDWQEFQDHATATRAEAPELFGCVKEAISVIAARPTQSPSGVPDGRSSIETSSSDGSSVMEFSTPDSHIGSEAPLLKDSRVQELLPVQEAARYLSAVG